MLSAGSALGAFSAGDSPCHFDDALGLAAAIGIGVERSGGWSSLNVKKDILLKSGSIWPT